MAEPVTIHLRPSAPIAPDALLPGDPGRALLLAQALLDEPRMSNHHRGLWGYYGETAEGRPLTIQATGMGGPSAAIVLEELVRLGVRRAVRVGTCGALDGGLELGSLLIAEAALVADGTSAALGAGERAEADVGLTGALIEAAGEEARVGVVVSTDLFYEDTPRRAEGWLAAGAVAVEMEAAALFSLGRRLGVAIGCALSVSDLTGPSGRVRIGDEELERASMAMGRVAAAALSDG